MYCADTVLEIGWWRDEIFSVRIQKWQNRIYTEDFLTSAWNTLDIYSKFEKFVKESMVWEESIVYLEEGYDFSVCFFKGWLDTSIENYLNILKQIPNLEKYSKYTIYFNSKHRSRNANWESLFPPSVFISEKLKEIQISL